MERAHLGTPSLSGGFPISKAQKGNFLIIFFSIFFIYLAASVAKYCKKGAAIREKAPGRVRDGFGKVQNGFGMGLESR